jgi:hypothetical protein
MGLITPISATSRGLILPFHLQRVLIERPVKLPSCKLGIEGPTFRGVMGWDTV